MTAVAIVTKIAESGLPAMLFLKDRAKGIKVGIGMISRGEVGLIVAQAGLSAGAVTRDVYTMVVIMVAATTIITPIWMKRIYKGEEKKKETKGELDKREQELQEEKKSKLKESMQPLKEKIGKLFVVEEEEEEQAEQEKQEKLSSWMRPSEKGDTEERDEQKQKTKDDQEKRGSGSR
ncbi:MAG: cation:proton antiporter, partial [Thermoproteota archaeon]|nr:cation:proton antiporter [Thermoproteota archaeon]